jgi:hypothetical protein
MAVFGRQSFEPQVRNYDPECPTLTVSISTARLTDPNLMNIEGETEYRYHSGQRIELASEILRPIQTCVKF